MIWTGKVKEKEGASEESVGQARRRQHPIHLGDGPGVSRSPESAAPVPGNGSVLADSPAEVDIASSSAKPWMLMTSTDMTEKGRARRAAAAAAVAAADDAEQLSAEKWSADKWSGVLKTDRTNRCSITK